MHAGFCTKERSLTRATILSFQLLSALHYLSVQVKTHVLKIHLSLAYTNRLQ
jgi:hypothetical protein